MTGGAHSTLSCVCLMMIYIDDPGRQSILAVGINVVMNVKISLCLVRPLRLALLDLGGLWLEQVLAACLICLTGFDLLTIVELL